MGTTLPILPPRMGVTSAKPRFPLAVEGTFCDNKGMRSRVNCPGMSAKTQQRTGRSGQALTEFAVVMVSLLLVLVMVSLFLYTFREYGGRVLNLVASEYP